MRKGAKDADVQSDWLVCPGGLLCPWPRQDDPLCPSGTDDVLEDSTRDVGCADPDQYLSLAILTSEQLKQWLSTDTPAHFATALVVGSVALVPGFVAFPLAGVLLKNGASVMLIAGFLTT